VARTTIDQKDLLFRNMDMNEVLSEAISFFVRHFGLIAGTVVLACLPLFAWQLLWYLQPGEWGPAQLYRSARDLLTLAGLTNVIFIDGNVNGRLVAGLLLGAYVSLARGGALAFAISESYLGRKVTPARAVAAANGRLAQLLLGNGVVAAIVIAVALLVPKVWPIPEAELYVFALIMMAILPRLLLVTPVVMIENASGAGGIRRSLSLVSGRFWFVFAIWLVMEIVLALLSLVPVFGLGLAQTALGGRNEMLANVIIPTLAMLFIDPVHDVVLVFVYYQLRRRKERFSIESLSD
jgi:hypothetical protein